MKRIFIVLLSTFLLFGCYNEEKEADKSLEEIVKEYNDKNYEGAIRLSDNFEQNFPKYKYKVEDIKEKIKEKEDEDRDFRDIYVYEEYKEWEIVIRKIDDFNTKFPNSDKKTNLLALKLTAQEELEKTKIEKKEDNIEPKIDEIRINYTGILNVRELNEDLTLKDTYRINLWKKNNFSKELLGSKIQYLDSHSIYYSRHKNGVDEYMTIIYNPENTSAKGHWKGTILEIDVSVTNINGGKKVTFKDLEKLLNKVIKYNTDKKQNQLIKQTLKTLKETDKIYILDFPEEKGIHIIF